MLRIVPLSVCYFYTMADSMARLRPVVCWSQLLASPKKLSLSFAHRLHLSAQHERSSLHFRTLLCGDLSASSAVAWHLSVFSDKVYRAMEKWCSTNCFSLKKKLANERKPFSISLRIFNPRFLIFYFYICCNGFNLAEKSATRWNISRWTGRRHQISKLYVCSWCRYCWARFITFQQRLSDAFSFLCSMFLFPLFSFPSVPAIFPSRKKKRCADESESVQAAYEDYV